MFPFKDKEFFGGRVSPPLILIRVVSTPLLPGRFHKFNNIPGFNYIVSRNFCAINYRIGHTINVENLSKKFSYFTDFSTHNIKVTNVGPTGYLNCCVCSISKCSSWSAKNAFKISAYALNWVCK